MPIALKRLISYALILVFATSAVQAQVKDGSHAKCGTSHWLHSMESKFPAFQQVMQSNELKLEQAAVNKKAAPTSNQKTAATYIIPVVFHIVLPNPSAVTDAQILAQLDILNKDWTGQNADSTKILPQFKGLYGKGNIQFCLAQRTPQDLPTSGIERISSSVQSTYSVGDPIKSAAAGGADQWDPTKYINVWVGFINQQDGVIGYATFPTGTPQNGFPQNEQGVVVHYRTLPGQNFAPYDLGRTLTHEMGHFFWLLHPWGNNGCDTDFPGTTTLDDTPAQNDDTNGCPSGTVATGCSPADPNGRLYQDFMDYSNDACLVMFTKGQNQRAELALTTFRPTLTGSNGCAAPPSVSNNAGVAAILSPNSSRSLCSSSAIGSIQLLNAGNNTLNSVVINIQVNGGAVTAVNWIGSIVPFGSATVTLPAIVFPAAINSLTIYTTKPNGVNDPLTYNDTARTTVNVAPIVSLPYLQGFESSIFPPLGWDRVQTPVDNVTWFRTTQVSKSGLASTYIDNYNYGNFYGRKDDLVTPTFDFGPVDSVFIKFDVAAATYFDAQNPTPPDTLEVAVTLDCGLTYQVVYKKWGTELATNGLGTTDDAFVPTATEWRLDSVNITNIVGTTGQFRVRIRNIENFGNNIFLDNFQVYTKTLPARLKAEGVLITPNPVYSTILVQHLLAPVELQGISIFNSAGSLVHRQQFFRTAGTYIPINISSLAAGMYTIKLDYVNKSIMQKFIKLQ
jgi:hypothetical protein